MAKIRIGLIGCGQIARCNHVPEMRGISSDVAEITAVYDIQPGKGERFVEEMELKNAVVCKSEQELLKSRIDAGDYRYSELFPLPADHCSFKGWKACAG